MTRTDSPIIPRWRSRLASLPPFSGKLRLINLAAAALRSIGRNDQKVFLWDGAEFCVDLRDRIQRQMWCGCYEPHVMGALRGILRAGDVFLDLGAHIGFHSYFAAGLVGPAGRVFAFEPDPGNYLRLKKNLEAFPYAQAEQCAIWSSETKLIFARSELTEESGWGALASVHNAPEREQIEVESVSLDVWTERSGVKAIRAAKIDVEGSEFEVLQGAGRVLQQMRPILLFEMNESLLLQAGASAAVLKQLLRRYEYKLHTLLEGSLQPWKGMGANETIDCLAIPEDFDGTNLHEISGLLRPNPERM
jgi:FkbM family methyltransferase